MKILCECELETNVTPEQICKYLESKGWKEIAEETYYRVYSNEHDVTVPVSKSATYPFYDWKVGTLLNVLDMETGQRKCDILREIDMELRCPHCRGSGKGLNGDCALCMGSGR